MVLFLQINKPQIWRSKMSEIVVETHTDENGETYRKSNCGSWFDSDGDWVKLDGDGDWVRDDSDRFISNCLKRLCEVQTENQQKKIKDFENENRWVLKSICKNNLVSELTEDEKKVWFELIQIVGLQPSNSQTT